VFNALGGDRLDDGIRFDAGRGAAAAHAEMDRLIAELRQRRGEGPEERPAYRAHRQRD
jgi:hypothetical protein